MASKSLNYGPIMDHVLLGVDLIMTHLVTEARQGPDVTVLLIYWKFGNEDLESATLTNLIPTGKIGCPNNRQRRINGLVNRWNSQKERGVQNLRSTRR